MWADGSRPLAYLQDDRIWPSAATADAIAADARRAGQPDIVLRRSITAPLA